MVVAAGVSSASEVVGASASKEGCSSGVSRAGAGCAGCMGWTMSENAVEGGLKYLGLPKKVARHEINLMLV